MYSTEEGNVMAKISTSKAAKGQSEPQVQLNKEQKKQAKREAKLRFKIELIQKSIQKAERKVTRAKADVDTLRAQLHELNEQLGHNHVPADRQEVEQDRAEVEQTPQADLVSETPGAEQELPVNGSVEFHDAPQLQQDEATIGEERPSVVNTGPALGDETFEDKEAVEELHHASLPPAEGRNDINSNPTSLPADATTEPTQEFVEQISSSEQDETSPASDVKEDSAAGQESSREAEQISSSEQDEASPVSDVKEDSATDQEESRDTEEVPTSRRRSTRSRTTNRKPRQS
jgi:hypothetical protein